MDDGALTRPHPSPLERPRGSQGEVLVGVVGPLRLGLADYWMAVTGLRPVLLRAETFLPVRGGLPVGAMTVLLLAGLTAGGAAGAVAGRGWGGDPGAAVGTTLGVLGGVLGSGLLLARGEPRRESPGERIRLSELAGPDLERALGKHRRNFSISVADVREVQVYEAPAGRLLEIHSGARRWRFEYHLTLARIHSQVPILDQALGDRVRCHLPEKALGGDDTRLPHFPGG